MKTQQCPRCKSKCAVRQQNIELGVLIECGCGCKFEHLQENLDNLVSDWTNNSQTPPRLSSEPMFSFAQKTNSVVPLVIDWTSHLLMTGILLVISFFLGLSMITTLLFICFILISFCLKNKKAKKKINDKSIGYFFFDKCLEFFVCLTIVVFFYAILSWLVEGTTNTTTLSRLESLENFLIEVSKFVSYLKIKPWYSALIILGLIVLDLLASYFLKPEKSAEESEAVSGNAKQPQLNLISRYKTYQTWSKRVCLVAVLLCSFTFFGNTVLGERVARLRINIDKIREGYAKLNAEAESSLAASVQQKIYVKVKQTLPADIRDNFDYPKILNTDLNNLRSNYEQFKKYGHTNLEAEQVLKNYETQAKQNENSSVEQIKIDEPAPAEVKVEKPSASAPKAETTVESIEKSLTEVKTKKTFRARSVSLLKLDSIKEILVQFPKSITAFTKGQIFGSKIFSEMIKTHPFLEPIVDVFTGTFDKVVEKKIKESADKVADAMLESPQKTEQVIEQEATKIADSVEIKKDEIALEKTRKNFTEIKNQIEKIRTVNETVSTQIVNEQEKELARADEKEKKQQREKIQQIREQYLDQKTGIYDCTCKCGARVLYKTTAGSRAECSAICHEGAPCI